MIKKIKNHAPNTDIKDLILGGSYTPAQMFLWFDESKKDHKERERSKDKESEMCETAEVLLQRGLNFKTMSQEEEYEIFSAYLQEQDPNKKAMLRDEFLCRNLRLVMHLAKQQAQRCEYTPKDLMAWGTLGMIRAFEKFELSHGVKFSTYAAQWIKQGMTRGLAETQRAIRVPYNILTDQNKMRKFCRQWELDTGVEATDEDICAHFKWSLKKLHYIRQGLTAISSIDIPAADGDDTIADLIEDDGATAVEDEVENNITRKLLLEAIAETLDDRSIDIIMNLYEFNGRNSLDKDQLAIKHNVSRERIIQIRDEAIAKLRNPSKSRKLRGLFAS